MDVKAHNFHMNDGPNVVISNALAVIVLELGQKWEHSLCAECPYRESAIDLIY